MISALITFVAASVSATLPSDWQNVQKFQLSSSGLTAISLPVETLDKSRPNLEDLRLYDDAGNEVPYLIERPATAGRIIRAAKSFAVTLNRGSTVVTLETGLTQPVDGVTLESPAASFIKAVLVEGSADAKKWQTLAEGQPIFRQPNGVSQMLVATKPAAWKWLRLTIDDQRSDAIPISGATVHAASVEVAPVEAFPVTISDRTENPGETRLTLNLGSANLSLVALELETTDPLFTRRVTAAIPQISEDTIREQTLAQGVIYRIAMEGQPVSASLNLPIEAHVRSRELFLTIRNDDSPPLQIKAVRGTRRPAYLIFLARQPGVFHVLTGNSHCQAPKYDLASMDATLKKAAVLSLPLSPISPNPNYRPPEALPGMQETGVALDVSPWRFRKLIKIEKPGAQQIELDLAVLSHAQSGLEDLRLLRGGKQVPYVVERTSIRRSLSLAVTAGQDAKDPKISRWTIKLSHSNLPITRLTCAVRTELFEREMSLYEERSNERGDKFRYNLGSASWVQTPGRARKKEFALELGDRPRQDTLYLETHNGDNAPIDIEKAQLYYPVTRILFKSQSTDDLFIYYGNADAFTPRYDLSLVANQLLTAQKTAAHPGAEELLKKGPWQPGRTRANGGFIFWGALALVVVVLLTIISRLLPKLPKP
jgi:hypothetical protein